MDLYEDEYVRYEFEDGILISKYKTKIIDLNIAKHVLSRRLLHFKAPSYSGLVDYSLVKETTKEARDFFATPEAIQNLNAIAVVTDSMIGNMIYNFYLTISKPSLPTKLFKSNEEALLWLKSL